MKHLTWLHVLSFTKANLFPEILEGGPGSGSEKEPFTFSCFFFIQSAGSWDILSHC
jgi:hypothetical protein